jgi:hypothetical protein
MQQLNISLGALEVWSCRADSLRIEDRQGRPRGEIGPV